MVRPAYQGSIRENFHCQPLPPDIEKYALFSYVSKKNFQKKSLTVKMVLYIFTVGPEIESVFLEVKKLDSRAAIRS